MGFIYSRKRTEAMGGWYRGNVFNGFVKSPYPHQREIPHVGLSSRLVALHGQGPYMINVGDYEGENHRKRSTCGIIVCCDGSGVSI